MSDADLNKSKGFYPSLEASRGVAALMVALFHSGQADYLDATGKAMKLVGTRDLVWRIAGNGHGAVIFFFVLSGFVLMLMLQRGSQKTSVLTFRFFVSRIFRILPASFSTIALFALVFAVTRIGLVGAEAYSLGNLLANAVLLRTDINGVMWSLQLEMIAAPLILAVYLVNRRWGSNALVILLVLFAGLSFAGSWNRLLGPEVSLGPLYCFLAGMIACIAGQQRRDPSHAIIWLVIGLVGFGAARPVLGWTSNWAVIIETLAASIIVIALSYGHIGWRIARPVARLLSFYGHISYSFYLLHPLTLLWLWKNPAPLGSIVAWGWPPPLLALALFVASTIAITPIAWMQQRYVERAGIAMGRRLIGKPQVSEGSGDLTSKAQLPRA